MKLRLTDYNDNTYMDTDGSCELCMYTGLQSSSSPTVMVDKTA